MSLEHLSRRHSKKVLSVSVRNCIEAPSAVSSSDAQVPFTHRPNKLGCSIEQLERLTNVKHSNLLGQFISYEENEVL